MRGGGRGWGEKEVTKERKMNGKRKVECGGKEIEYRTTWMGGKKGL